MKRLDIVNMSVVSPVRGAPAALREESHAALDRLLDAGAMALMFVAEMPRRVHDVVVVPPLGCVESGLSEYVIARATGSHLAGREEK